MCSTYPLLLSVSTQVFHYPTRFGDFYVVFSRSEIVPMQPRRANARIANTL